MIRTVIMVVFTALVLCCACISLLALKLRVVNVKRQDSEVGSAQNVELMKKKKKLRHVQQRRDIENAAASDANLDNDDDASARLN